MRISKENSVKLSRVIQLANKAGDKLKYVRIISDDLGSRAFATDNDSTLVVYGIAEGDGDVAIAASDAQKMFCGKYDVELTETESGYKFDIGRGSSERASVDPNTIPIRNMSDMDGSEELDGDELRQAASAAMACRDDGANSRFQLACAHVSSVNGQVQIAATNGRVAVAVELAGSGEEITPTLVPPDALKFIQTTKADIVELLVDGQAVKIREEDTIAEFRAIGGRFPDISKVIAEPGESVTFGVDTAAIAEDMGLATWDQSNFKIREGRIAECDGPGVFGEMLADDLPDVVLNSEYVSKLISAFSTCEISIVDEKSPVYVKLGDRENAAGVIMPIARN